jgi:hypothetical protein
MLASALKRSLKSAARAQAEAGTQDWLTAYMRSFHRRLL